jgi:hypothetical protein
MKEFRTEVKVSPASRPVDIKSGILTQGSCFADAIGHRLASHKMKTLINPFGVIYNPESIHKVFEYSIFNEPLPEHTYVHHHEVYSNYNFHSEFSARTKDELASRLTNTIGSTHYFLKDADWLLLTYGTAWSYQRKETGEVVANCHKLPSAMFTKSLMTLDAISASFKNLFNHLKKFNPKIKIILTVSPVRHLKDTLELNSVSKSLLRVACHHFCTQYDDVEYFPAFEMMMDDLRDYRFYKEDMLHPTSEAEDYIWEKFVERYFSTDMKEFVKKWKVVSAALRHKPFHPQTALHQQFLRDTLKKLEELERWVKVEDEKSQLKQQLIKHSHHD